jgi:uncharacterized protein YbjT (DUF2867 family)
VSSNLVLVTGATGYIGGRLVRELLDEGLRVRVFVRDKAKTLGHSWANEVEVFVGDANTKSDLEHALDSVHTAYYLLHSLNIGRDFENVEHQMAKTFASAAQSMSIKQIVYLGGINNDTAQSKHLSSRTQVGQALRDSGIPTIELRAGMVLGSGSASFEMLRHLTHRLPIMTTPKWINNLTHPIAVRDVLWYLKKCALLSKPENGIFDIGGPEPLTYAQLMQEFAKVSNLSKRIIISIPVLTPTLASHWIGFVTPLPRSLAKNLVESLISEVVVDPKKDISKIIAPPPGGTLPVTTAIELALNKVNNAQVDTRWSDAMGSNSPWSKLSTDPDWAGVATFRDIRVIDSTESPQNLWAQIEAIGGETGWYGADLLWSVRGLLDTAIGGAGLRRGRRDPLKLRAGESLDFWRVEEIDHGRYLRLNAEMKLPGEAWLEFELIPTAKPEVVQLKQTATFIPKGLFGNLYWYVIAPFHFLVFPTMIRNIEKAAKARSN